MCEPMTIMVALTAAAAATSGVSAYQTSQTNKDMAEYQAGVERNNRTMAHWAAEDALDRGARDEVAARRQVRALKGEQVNRLAANGLSLDAGAPLAILQDTDYFGEQETLNVRNKARRESWGYRMQGQNAGASAAMYQARADAEDPLMAAGLSLLGSAGSVASSWYRYGGKPGGGK